MAMADAFLEHKLGDGYEDWDGFYEFHKLGYDELEHFDYEAYKANGFEIPNPGCAPSALNRSATLIKDSLKQRIAQEITGALNTV